MTQDHYAILGVTPTAEPAVIRAAYLALMREYHPDRNPSPAAALRAQAIIAAFKVLGDFDRRNEYDWGRRRARDKAAALEASSPRKYGRGAVAIGAIGLAAVAAIVMRPDGAPAPVPAPPPPVEIADATAKRTPPAHKTKRRSAVTREHDSAPAPAKPKAEPQLDIIETAAVEPKPSAPIKLVRANRALPERTKGAAVKLAAVEPIRAKAKPVLAKPVVAMPHVARATPSTEPKPTAKTAPAPRPGNSADLAALDQFVMSFYGQSWRYGDARKRAALAQSRDSFVVRRGACAADACKRAAYLKLMRDVSEIVETGQPRTR